MGIASHHIASLENVELISPSTYGSVSKIWNMFFTGIGANYVREFADKVPTAPVDKTAIDTELVLIIYARVHPDYRHHLDGLTSGLKIWHAVRDFCVTTNLQNQVNIWHRFTHVHHDIDRPIGVYISQVDSLVRALEGFGYRPSTTFHLYTLLDNLDSTYRSVRSAIYNMSPIPTLETVKAKIASECVDHADLDSDDPVVKTEGAYAARFGSSQYPHRSGGSNRTSGDDGKFRWCSANHPDQCRRCGRTGHISDRCIHDMPQHVKDWVISGAPKSGRNHSDDSDTTAAASVAEADSPPMAFAASAQSGTLSGPLPGRATHSHANALEHAFNLVAAAQVGKISVDRGVLQAAFKCIEGNAEAYAREQINLGE
ncbi:hypothetical protein EV361DRAFT_931797 [Lentinula raphanica]|nr:hypothetical protein EV361DRAFT_931797 [Lentinula raphanica]